jgi:hypothetical protein
MALLPESRLSRDNHVRCLNQGHEVHVVKRFGQPNVGLAAEDPPDGNLHVRIPVNRIDDLHVSL